MPRKTIKKHRRVTKKRANIRRKKKLSESKILE